jgi:hypothetical protein
MIATTHHPAAEGERLKREALALLEVRRETYIVRGRRALLARLLDVGTATADDVRAAVPIPTGINPKCFGAVPGQLARAGIIGRVGFAETTRREGHARPLSVWRLIDRAGALQWLADHPDRADQLADSDTPPEAVADAPLIHNGNAAADAPTSAGANGKDSANARA